MSWRSRICVRASIRNLVLCNGIKCIWGEFDTRDLAVAIVRLLRLFMPCSRSILNIHLSTSTRRVSVCYMWASVPPCPSVYAGVWHFEVARIGWKFCFDFFFHQHVLLDFDGTCQLFDQCNEKGSDLLVVANKFGTRIIGHPSSRFLQSAYWTNASVFCFRFDWCISFTSFGSSVLQRLVEYAPKQIRIAGQTTNAEFELQGESSGGEFHLGKPIIHQSVRGQLISAPGRWSLSFRIEYELMKWPDSKLSSFRKTCGWCMSFASITWPDTCSGIRCRKMQLPLAWIMAL